MKFIDFEGLYQTYNPEIIQPHIPPEAKTFCFLTVVDQALDLERFATFIRDYSAAFQDTDDVSLLIYTETETLIPQLSCLIENLAQNHASFPDILLMEEALPPQEIPTLFRVCHTYIEVQAHYSRAVKALLMNHPVCLITEQPVPDYLAIAGATSISLDPSTITNQLRALWQTGQNKKNYRSQMGSQLITKQEWFQQILDTNVVVLLIWGRSGTLFMQSLLDSHPNLLMVPPNPAFMDFHYSQWPMLDKHSNHQIPLLTEAFIQINPVIFDGCKDTTNIDLGHLGEDRLTPVFCNETAFAKHTNWLLSELSLIGHPLSRKTFFLAIHYAYAMAIGQDVSDKNWIVHQFHTSHNLTGMIPLHEDFPNLMGIGMMRNPITSFNSHMRVQVQDKLTGHLQILDPDYTWEHLVYDGWYSHLYRHILVGWSRMEKTFGFPIHVVKLEDLHTQPEQTMKQLADRLNIQWHLSLLESTYNGLKYWGDKSMIQQLSGFSTEHPQHSSGEIQLDDWDQYVLLGLLQHLCETYRYPTLNALQKKCLALAILVPTKLERSAFIKALKEGNRMDLENTVLSLFERYLFSFRYLFGREIREGLWPR